jgi:SAM-dependent methyltransferase
MEREEQFKCPTGSIANEVAVYMNHHHDALFSWGLSHIKIDNADVILDVGCGGGELVKKLAQITHNGKVFGIDYSRDMVRFSKNLNAELIRANRVEILEASVEKTDFPNKTFDLVTAVETYYFWQNLPNALREIARILKPDGKLILINELIKNGSFEITHAKLIREKSVKLFTLSELRDMLETAGFANIQTFVNKSPLNKFIKRDRQFWNAMVGNKTDASEFNSP